MTQSNSIFLIQFQICTLRDCSSAILNACSVAQFCNLRSLIQTSISIVLQGICLSKLNLKGKVLAQIAESTVNSLAQSQILNIAITVLILKRFGCQNLIAVGIHQSNKIAKISSSSGINFLCVDLADNHRHSTTLSSHRLVCLIHALNDGKSILTNRLAFSQLRNIQLKGASIDTFIVFATLRSIITCIKFHRFSIQCCTGSCRTLINIKVKLHAIGRSTISNRQNLG